MKDVSRCHFNVFQHNNLNKEMRAFENMKREVPHFQALAEEQKNQKFIQAYHLMDPFFRWAGNGTDRQDMVRSLSTELGVSYNEIELTGWGTGSRSGEEYLLEGNVDVGHLVARLMPYYPPGAKFKVNGSDIKRDMGKVVEYLEQKYGGQYAGQADSVDA